MGRAGAVAWTGAAGASGVMGRVGAVGGWSSAHPGYVSGAARGCDVAARGGRRGVQGCQWGWK